MLKNTFLHLPGIGSKKEHALWEAGVLTWDDYEFLVAPQASFFSMDPKSGIAEALVQSRKALERGDMDFFADRLPKKEHYRIALTVPDQTAFLDIETTGLSHYYDEITLIGVSIGDQYSCLIRGANREDTKQFQRMLEQAKCLVTFNGTIFDLKFIQKEFPDFVLPRAHVDLRFFVRTVGMSGGQKRIEETIGLERAKDIKGMSGERAPLLWHEYRLGDRKSAQQLIKYNHADVEGMREILDYVTLRRARRDADSVPTNASSFARKGTKIAFAESRATEQRNRVFVPKYRKERGPKITYSELASEIDISSLRVVGIDLTGSEKRPTGWCSLIGNRAYTKRIGSDLDLFVETLNVQPHLVSIDSPLSLPMGRIRATDDDPGRDEFGIMRQCERTLKARGVNVYPALIPNMQTLTARGIRLASMFRQLGIPVIESYPGAAQDIMDIPRKKAGLEYLAKGLADFGIEGAFTDNEVSHDELDAITSAIVGIFFWTGKFEGLGDQSENYLIIPDLDADTAGWCTRRVVGVSGPIAAGKTTAAKHLEKSKSAFAYGRYSLVLENELRGMGKPVNRNTLQEYGRQVNVEIGQRGLSRRLVESLPLHEDLVIDGLRFPEDHAYMVEYFGPAFRHIHVHASENIRRERYVALRKSQKEFRNASAHLVEAKVLLLAKLAHEIVINEAKIEGFTRRFESAIKQRKTH